MNKLIFLTTLLAVPVLLPAQSGGLDPADILKPLVRSVDELLGRHDRQAL